MPGGKRILCVPPLLLLFAAAAGEQPSWCMQIFVCSAPPPLVLQKDQPLSFPGLAGSSMKAFIIESQILSFYMSVKVCPCSIHMTH